MVEELRSGISYLAQHPPQFGQALRSLGLCCHKFLQKIDADGFHWSSVFLESFLLCRMSFTITPDSTNKLFSYLQTCCFNVDESLQGESSIALAAFFVGCKSVHGSKLELAIDWFTRSHSAARSPLLKYKVAFALYDALSDEENFDDALKWLNLAIQVAQGSEAINITRFTIGLTLASLGKFESAQQIGFDSTSNLFSVALKTMMDAEIRRLQQESFQGKQLISAYATARRLLIGSCMPNLGTKLEEFLGNSDCCSQEFLLQFLDLDGFSKYMIRDLDGLLNPGGELAAREVSSSFFAYNMYFHGRKRIIKLQEDNIFVDPRPHFEEALDRFWQNEVDIDSLVLCQQISIKAGHWTCFHKSAQMLSVLKERLEVDKAFYILSSSFCENGSDGEDPDAWAAYYCSGAATIPDIPVSSKSYDKEFLKRCLRHARTSALKVMAALHLAIATDETTEKLELLERAKDYAFMSHNEHFIIQTSVHLFEALQPSRKYSKMHQLKEQLSNLTLQSCPNLLCLEALVKWINGSTQSYLDIHNRIGHSHEELRKCIDVTISLGLVEDSDGVFYRYFTTDEQLPLSSIENHYMNHISASARQQVNHYEEEAQGLIHHCSTANYPEDFLLLFYHFRSLVLEFKLEEAETACAHMLNVHPVHTAYTLIQLVKLCARYYERDYCNSSRKSEVVEKSLAEIMESVVTAAIAFEKAEVGSPYFLFEAYWYHAEGFEALGWQSHAIEKMEESLKAFSQDDANFELFSDGRIQYLDMYYPRFQKLQLALIASEDADKSLIWSERQRTRDFMYTLRTQDRESYLKELAVFDMDDSQALEEIAASFRMAGDQVVVIVINQYKVTSGDWIFVTFFVHPGLHANKLLAHYQEVRADHVIFTATVEDIINKSMSDPEFKDYFQTLHRLLIEPFKAELRDVKPKKIIFVPSKETSTIPFNFLLDELTGLFLIQEYAIATIASLRMLGMCERRKVELEEKIEHDEPYSLVVGDPTNDLGFASEEAHSVSSVLLEKTKCKVNVLHSQSATKQAVLDKLPSSHWIHIACHGIVDSDQFPEGALLLATNKVHLGKPRDSSTRRRRVVRALIAANETEKLLGQEIVQHCQGMKACGAILTACSTGVGRKSAEGILALPRSFHMCGVPSVVVSLWDVDDDDDTSKLIDLFYGKLLQGTEIAEALQLAIVQMLSEEHEVYGGPAYHVITWAPFTISGCCSTKLPFPLLTSS